MGLLDHPQSDLTKLKYGKDRAGGGSSNQPYIQTPLTLNLPPPLEFLGNDFLLRGGAGAPLDAAEDVIRLTKYFTDTKSPSGLLFIAKQNLLSRLAVRTQASNGLVNEGIYTPLSTIAQAGVGFLGTHLNKQGINPIPGAVGSLRTYSDAVADNVLANSVNGVSELLGFLNTSAERLVTLFEDKMVKASTFLPDADVLTYAGGPGSVLGIGKTHIQFADQRTGINNPWVKNSGFFKTQNQGYNDFAVFRRIAPTYESSRIFNLHGLSAVYSDLIFGNYNELYSPDYFNPDGDNDDLLKFNPNVYQTQDGVASFDINPEALKSGIQNRNYQGELLGIKKPIGASKLFPGLESGLELNYFTSSLESSGSNAHYFKVNEGTGPDNPLVFTQQEINNAPNVGKGLINATNFSDFRKTIRARLAEANVLTVSPDYFEFGIENRLKMGDPGNGFGKNLVSYTNGKQNGAASHNSYDQMALVPLYKSDTVDSTITDLVNFRIGAIDNDDPTQKVYIHFRAFLGAINDSYSSDINSAQYVGRGEKFYNYAGFDRKISLSFTIAAQSKIELIPLYEKLNYLISNLAPDYSGNGYMRGPLVTLTIGGYIIEQPGYITGLNVEMSEDTSWEIGINDEGEKDPTTKQLAHVIRVSGFTFTPIHRFAVRKENENNLPATKYILNEDPPVPPVQGPISVPPTPEPLPPPVFVPPPVSKVPTSPPLAVPTNNPTPIPA